MATQIIPGAVAPADGSAAFGVRELAPAFLAGARSGPAISGAEQAPRTAKRRQAAALQNDPRDDYGPNNERLEELRPRLVAALRDLVMQFREEGIVARRHEIRRIRQARLFWQGLQYAWWNPNDMNWHLPFEQRINDDTALQEMPRYQFVTNFYQGFGLSFVAIMSQDVPTTRFYPQSAQREEDISAAKAASEAAKLIEQNNRVQNLLTGVGYYLWTDGKIGGYVRYVADGQRFGFHNEDLIEERLVKLGEDVFVCPSCGAETPLERGGELAPSAVQGAAALPFARQASPGYATAPTNGGGLVGARLASPSVILSAAIGDSGPAGKDPSEKQPQGFLAPREHAAAANLLAGTICPHCGAPLREENFRPAELVPVPEIVETQKVPNGQEVITIVGGLELNSPVWASEMHEYPYLQWQTEVHRAKLKASYPHAADKIQMGAPPGADDVYARASRIAVAQGLPTVHPGDALHNLITFSRTWIRPWSFYALEDKSVRDELLDLFPNGCYVAFAGETYCESRNETMDDHWRVMHALPGDGQNRPSVGDALVQVQERYNILSNIQAETYEFGIPPIYADPQVLDFDALQGQVAEPAAHYPARAKPGQPLAAGFFQPAPAQVPPDMFKHQQDLVGPVAQFLTGLFPAVFGGEMKDVKTATGYSLARDQALGRLGLVWRRLKAFYADLMLLGVDCLRKNRPDDAEIPFLGEGGAFESKWIRLADLKGNIQAHPEADETFPRLKSQQRGVLQQLMTSPDPMIQRALSEPANLGFIKSVIGLTELVIPGEDSRNKQLREIQQLLAGSPVVIPSEARNLSDALPLAPRLSAPPPAPAAPAHDAAPTPLECGGELALSGVEGPPLSPQAGLAPPSVTLSAARNLSDSLVIAPGIVSSVPVDELLDDHAVEFEECKRWANSDAGQAARAQNPAGFANVRAHAAAHLAALQHRKAGP